ncbi:MCE family protein [Gordonia neofelifaecis]|uniref:Mammalian cell entry related domain-containing protein n=1 Tax=Gordonia neofelifaecis NRRL B-59395 TaxID=644548 RepID=F1YHP7_9ACTN|nr:MCE family protein [Gordonia neofelifaecis]EGD55885.1 mammalian cell entry related domain-containing protein [Gordonia neofelifaecis NRRL B-59395]
MKIDTGGRDPSLKTYFIRGAIFLAVGVLVLGLLLARYEGKFEDRTEVTAQMTDVGDGLVSGADVRYNGFIVGSVDTITMIGSGDDPTKDVALILDPQQASGIPANTTARTVPSNLFGVNSVELIAPANPSSESLSGGDVVKADTSEPTIRLQDAQNELRTLLRSVPPEDLGMVLGTIADALQGGGATFSTFVGVLDTYWKTINAQFPPGAPSGFDNFNAAVRGLAKSTPQLLDALGKSVVPAVTIAQNSDQLTALLSAGQGMLDQVQTLFAKNGDGGKRIVRDLNTMLGAITFEPDSLPQGLQELYVLAGRVLGVFTGVNGHVQLNLGVSFGAFQQYTRQNCPVYDGGPYGTARGPGCVGPGTGTGPTMSGPLTIYPPGMKRAAAQKPVSAVTTGKDGKTLKGALGRQPSAADSLMLGPLVSAVAPKEGGQ